MTTSEKIRIMLKAGHDAGAIARFLNCDVEYVCAVRWRDAQPAIDGLSYQARHMRKKRAADPEYRARERAQHVQYKRRRKAQSRGVAA
jgi:hypothetical protein